MIKFLLMSCAFVAGAGAGYGGPILYRMYSPEIAAAMPSPVVVAAPTIHPARPVSWWMQHTSPELAKMVPWCRDHDPGSHQFQDCRNATEAMTQLQIEAALRPR